jgi:ethanolamine utilization protein EutA
MPNQQADNTFSSTGRIFEEENEIELLSVGVDIGSSTSHIVFSKILMEQVGSRYVVKKRSVVHESDIILTPYADATTINADALGNFIDTQYKLAGLEPDDIDTGALILTGVAVRRSNSRAIAELFAAHAGKFVAVSAGDALETMLVAYGSGAVDLSAQKHMRVMNVDIGGGTSKIAVCIEGEVTDLTAIDVGARVICLDAEGCIERIEEAGRYYAEQAGTPLKPGDRPSSELLLKIVDIMTDKLFQAMGAQSFDPETATVLRLNPLQKAQPPDLVTFSGGVSEYIYGREKAEFGDLGPLLAASIKARMNSWNTQIHSSRQGIRATVIGASQYTTQLSGNTIFVTPHSTLPLRNIPVIVPNLPLVAESLDPTSIADTLSESLSHLKHHENIDTIALYFRWQGSATFARIDAFCRGVIQGLHPLLEKGAPLILVSEGDIGGLLGLHCHEVCQLENPVVSIDGILLKAFDYIDIGALLEASGAVPVVIKSLVFPESVALGRTTTD